MLPSSCARDITRPAFSIRDSRTAQFACGQVDRLSLAPYAPRRRIELHVSAYEPGDRSPACPAYQRTQPRSQFVEVDRFDDVVVGATVEGRQFVGLVAAAGHDDDRHRIAGTTKAPQDAEAVEVRQVHVEHHGGEPVQSDRIECFDAVSRPGNVESETNQTGSDAITKQGVVLDEQDFHRMLFDLYRAELTKPGLRTT
jgi:hypothetical protein